MLSSRTFQKLARTRERGLFSLYLPTVERGREIQQNPIRLKNLVAACRLNANGTVALDSNPVSSNAVGSGINPAIV